MSQLIASASKTLQIWEFTSKDDCKSISKCHFTDFPTSLSWNHTNQVVAVGLADKKIDLVQSSTGQLLSTVPFTSDEEIIEQIRALKFSGNSRYLASAVGTEIMLWDLKKRSLKSKLKGNKAPVVSVSFFGDGTIAAGDSGGAIRIWDVKSDSSYQEMSMHMSGNNSVGLTCMELSHSGSCRIATGYSDGSLCLWDPVTLTQLTRQEIHTNSISALSFSPKNPRLVATSSFDGRMALVDTANRNIGSKTSDPSASIDIGERLTSITFHEDAIHCAVGTQNGKVLFYDWRNVRKPIITIEAEGSHPVYALSFQIPKSRSDAAVTTPLRKTGSAEIGSSLKSTGSSATDSKLIKETTFAPQLKVSPRMSASLQTNLQPNSSASKELLDSSVLGIENTPSIKYDNLLLKGISLNKEVKKKDNEEENEHLSIKKFQFMDTSDPLSGAIPFKNDSDAEESAILSERSATSSELRQAMQMMRYDIHKEFRGFMREQVRQFAIAKEDTTEIVKELGLQLEELLKKNKDLKMENDLLRGLT